MASQRTPAIGSGLLDGLDDDDRSLAERLTSGVHVGVHARLAVQGRHRPQLVVVEHGEASVEVDGEVVDVLREGSFFVDGLFGIRSGTATVAATTPMRLQVQQRAEARLLAELVPAVARRIDEALLSACDASSTNARHRLIDAA